MSEETFEVLCDRLDDEYIGERIRPADQIRMLNAYVEWRESLESVPRGAPEDDEDG